MRDEIGLFRGVVGAKLGGRIFLVVVAPHSPKVEGGLLVPQGKLFGELPGPIQGLEKAVLRAALRRRGGGVAGGGRVSQQAVKAAAIQGWMDGKPELRAGELGRATGASKPTVALAISAMLRAGVLVPGQGEGFGMPRGLPWEKWRQLAQAQTEDRKVVRFADPSGLSRSPQELAKRLVSLQGKGEAVAVDLSGVLGAWVYDPELDITAAPRLDLSVYDGDLRFIAQLDAALVRTDDPNGKAVVVVHLTRDIARRRPPPGQPRAASVLDCLADLLDLGLQAEAKDFVHAVERRRQAEINEEFEP